MSLFDTIAAACVNLPSAVPPAARVYKDECMYSFDTAENNAAGLDVCLSCFQAFARTAHCNYTLAHYHDRGHPAYLNIVKRLRPEPERRAAEERAAKVPRLEIVEQKASDLYDTAVAVYVAARDEALALDRCPPHTQALARSVLAANSAATADDIKAWESEVFTCSHSLAVQPSSPAPPPALDRCVQCGLKENLWLCLACGAVGCGREQFGSSLKGNSHALSHFQDSGHHVAVKLGSLSADADACDCYCYQCNDEVKVPALAPTLLSFGVDLSSAVKSEKNLIELNLDTNKNWQFNLDGANGEKLAAVFGPGLTGLSNLGNSCYLNSVLQALFSFPRFRAFFKDLHFDKAVPDPAQDLPSQMIKLYDGLVSGRYSKPSDLKGEEYQAGIKPSSFKALIGADHTEFKTNRQQDANEFLLYLMDKLDREFGVALSRPFKFLLASKVVTSEKKVTSSSQLVDNVSIPIPKKILQIGENGEKTYESTTFEKCFELFSAPETIDGFEDSDGIRTTATKTEGFRTFPDYLIVSLQRIGLENWVPVKQNIPVAVPEFIDLSPYQVRFEEGETEVEHSNTKKFAPNEEALTTLLSMGFSEPRCLRGLFNTGNKNAEDAMNWVFAHMDDPDIDSAFDGEEAAEAASVPDEAVENLVSMGFSAHLAKKALHVSGNNANAAVEWLFSNPDDDGVIEPSKPQVNVAAEAEKIAAELAAGDDGSSHYALKAVVCHKGTSTSTGHYVAFIKVDGRWCLFNDEKIVDCGGDLTDVQKNGYVYFFENVGCQS